MYMLDTNICIYVINKRPPHILNTFESVGSDSLCISVITQAELQYGVEKSSNPARNQAILDELTQDGEWDDLAGGNFGEWI